MANRLDALHTPVPQTPGDSSRPGPILETVEVQEDNMDTPDLMKTNIGPETEPFAPPALSDSQSESGIEGNETSDALTGAAISLAAARARLRQATIGNSTSGAISGILRDLEMVASKLDGVINDISDQPRGVGVAESPQVQSEAEEPTKSEVDPRISSRKFSGISDSAEIARLRGMRGALEIGNDFDEAAAAQEISDLRRVRRQLRYLFALESRKLEVEISDPVVTSEVVSSRRLSSRQWAQSLVQKLQQ